MLATVEQSKPVLDCTRKTIPRQSLEITNMRTANFPENGKISGEHGKTMPRPLNEGKPKPLAFGRNKKT
jgi:hypothetical protein